MRGVDFEGTSRRTSANAAPVPGLFVSMVREAIAPPASPVRTIVVRPAAFAAGAPR